MKKHLLIVFGIITVLLWTERLGAAECVGPDAAAVQTAINNASSGSTIFVCAGNATWGTNVTISGKAITLQGAGAANTHITLNANERLHIVATTQNFVTVKDFEFIDGSIGNDPSVFVSGDARSEHVGFRVTGSTFSACYPHCLGVEGVYGVIDHNTFFADGMTQHIEVQGDYEQTDSGTVAWNIPLALGTNKFVYVEDNTFYGPCDGAIDGFNGARAVMRYNKFYNCSPGTHGIDTGGHRSFAYLEVHHNDYYNTGTHIDKRIGTTRGGSGIWYDNVLKQGPLNNGLTMQYWRMCNYQNGPWGRCDGTNYKLGSDFRSAATTGMYNFCSNQRDKFCTSNAQCSGGGTCTAFFDGPASASGYPCRDQPGVGPGQVSAPIYSWNNWVKIGSPFTSGYSCSYDTAPNIQENRDYYNDVAIFDGTVGIGKGELQARPATCTTGVGYWSTTDNKLYTCASTNTWIVYYTPYTYPHPLVSDNRTLMAPTNFRLK